MFKEIAYYSCTAVEALFSVFGLRGVYEQPPYTVISEIGPSVEIRDYQPRAAVEATVAAADRRQGSRLAFTLLFSYISGSNKEMRTLETSGPVEVTTESALIAMTAPVQTATGPLPDSITMRFFLPGDVAALPPQPLDEQLKIVHLPAETVAVLQFSGVLDDAARQENEQRLLTELADPASAWQIAGAPFVLTYDPPFAIPFLRRNEIAVDVVSKQHLPVPAPQPN